MPTKIDQRNKFPFKVMNEFDDDLMDYTEALKQVFEKWWKTSGIRGAIKRRTRTDAPDPFQRAFKRLDKNYQQVWQKENVRADVNKMARLTTTKAHADLKAEIRGYTGYDPMLKNQKSKQLAQDTIDQSVGYIKSIPDEYHREVKRVIHEGVRKGLTTDEIAANLSNVYQVSAASSTRTIAMDQVGNLYGAINKAQQQALGLKRFEWVAVMDGRTRDRHREFNGHTFTWENGANGEYPGSAINCRCYAATVKSEVQSILGV